MSQATRRVSCLIAALATLCALAHAAEPTVGPACEQALEALQAREAELLKAPSAARPDKPDATWLALRHRAARACLGAGAEGDTATRRSAAPPAVAPPIGLRPVPSLGAPLSRPSVPSVPSAKPLSMPLPPVQPARPPAIITACDAAGCWTSDGTRLPKIGPNLLSPRGLCTAQGAVLVCP